jgi:hypothetical protein
MTTLEISSSSSPENTDGVNLKIAKGYDAAAELLGGLTWDVTPLGFQIIFKAKQQVVAVARAHWDAHMRDYSGTVRTPAEQKAALAQTRMMIRAFGESA